MKVVIQAVNRAFKPHLLECVEKIEHPRYTFVRQEGPSDANYVFDCDEDDPWVAVDGLKGAIRRSPLGGIMFCQVVPYGMYVWPPLFDKDKYARR